MTNEQLIVIKEDSRRWWEERKELKKSNTEATESKKAFQTTTRKRDGYENRKSYSRIRFFFELEWFDQNGRSFSLLST
jgi:hypothetical protein